MPESCSSYPMAEQKSVFRSAELEDFKRIGLTGKKIWLSSIKQILMWIFHAAYRKRKTETV